MLASQQKLKFVLHTCGFIYSHMNSWANLVLGIKKDPIRNLRLSQINISKTPNTVRVCVRVCVCVCSVVSDSLHLACQTPLSWDSPGKNTRVGIISCSRGYSQSRDWICNPWVSCIAGWFFTHWAIGETYKYVCIYSFIWLHQVLVVACGSSSLTRDGTPAPWIGSVES